MKLLLLVFALIMCSCPCGDNTATETKTSAPPPKETAKGLKETLVVLTEKEHWTSHKDGDFLGYICIGSRGDKFLIQSSETFEIGDRLHAIITTPRLDTWNESGTTKTVSIIKMLKKEKSEKNIEALTSMFNLHERFQKKPAAQPTPVQPVKEKESTGDIWKRGYDRKNIRDAYYNNQ